jgi:hypothetical protein
MIVDIHATMTSQILNKRDSTILWFMLRTEDVPSTLNGSRHQGMAGWEDGERWPPDMEGSCKYTK